MNFIVLIPEIFLSVMAMLLLVAGVLGKGKYDITVKNISIISLIVALFILISTWGSAAGISRYYIHGMFENNQFILLFKMLIIGSGACVLMLSKEEFRGKKGQSVQFEFPVLMLLSIVGMMILVSASDLMSLYMGLELQSLALYILAAIKRDNVKSGEAGLKYFMLGALSSGILLYGCSLIYGFTGSTNFADISNIIANSHTISIGILFGMIFVLIGLFFKVSAAPFHMWAPDVYEGAPKIVTAFFATAPKVAAIAILVRFSFGAFGDAFDSWQQIIIVAALLSMLVGSFGALKQTNIKRLMAYSSIGHVGFILVGLAAGGINGAHSVALYSFIYVIMNIGTFAFIILMKRNGKNVEDISDLSGVATSRPLFAAIIAILMLSMAGIPPLAGFYGKFYVFSAAIKTELYSLAIIGVLTSAVAAFYYLRIIKIMYFDKNLQGVLDDSYSKSTKVILASTAVFNLLFFVRPTEVIELTKQVSGALF